jgi:hypothetical protein
VARQGVAAAPTVLIGPKGAGATSHAATVAATAHLAVVLAATSRAVAQVATEALVGAADATMTAQLAVVAMQAPALLLGKVEANLVAAQPVVTTAAMMLAEAVEALATVTGVALLPRRAGLPVASKAVMGASAATVTNAASGRLTHPSLSGRASLCATKASLRCPVALRVSVIVSL